MTRVMAFQPATVDHDSELRRVLGPFDATCIVIGAVVGVGIFFTPSSVARTAGTMNLAMAAWIVAGVIGVCGSLCFAELGGIYHRSAGQYEVLRDAYGPMAGFACVFCNATAILSGAAAVVSYICATNLNIAIWGVEPSDSTRLACGATLIGLLLLINLLGVVWGSAIQNISVTAKILTLLAVAGVAYFAGPPNTDAVTTVTQNESSGMLPRLMMALVPAIFSYGGWQQGLWIAGEIKNPGRNLPRAIIGGMAIVTIVYLLANWAYFKLLGYSGVAGSNALAADAVARQWPNVGRRVIAGAVALSAFGIMNSQLLNGPRLVYGMARDGRFFSVFGRVSKRFATPYAAIFLIGSLALILMFAASIYPRAIDQLLTGVVAVDGIFFLLTGIAIFVLRRQPWTARRSFSVPLYPLTPIVFVLFESAVVAGSFFDPEVRKASLLGLAWVAASIVIYLMFFRGNRQTVLIAE